MIDLLDKILSCRNAGMTQPEAARACGLTYAQMTTLIREHKIQWTRSNELLASLIRALPEPRRVADIRCALHISHERAILVCEKYDIPHDRGRMTRRHYSPDEDRIITVSLGKGLSYQDVAQMIRRSAEGIRERAVKIGVMPRHTSVKERVGASPPMDTKKGDDKFARAMGNKRFADDPRALPPQPFRHYTPTPARSPTGCAAAMTAGV